MPLAVLDGGLPDAVALRFVVVVVAVVVMVVARGVLAVLVGMLTVVVLERMLHRDATRPERQVVYSVNPMRDGTPDTLNRTHSPPGSIIGNQHFFRRALYVLGLRCGRAAAAPGGVAAALPGDGRRRPRSRSCAPLSFLRLIPIFDRLAQLEFFVGDVPSPRLVKKRREKVDGNGSYIFLANWKSLSMGSIVLAVNGFLLMAFIVSLSPSISVAFPDTARTLVVPN